MDRTDRYFIGVDGGGTYTKAVAANQAGKICACAFGDTINFNAVSFDTAQKNLEELLDRLTQTLGNGHIDQIFIGCSALDNAADDTLTHRLLGRYGSLDAGMNSDLYVALIGHVLDKSGVMIVSGTGSMGIARSLSGEIYICGGWGYAFGDEGSAFNIAVKGLRAATQYYDGRGEPTLLYEAMMDFFQLNEPRDLVPILYHPALDRKRAAGFSVCVSKCCEAGDDIACRILEGAAADLASIAGVLIERVEQFSSIAVYGGVLQNDRFVRESFTCRMQKRWPGIKIVDPEMPPEIGAVAAAMQRSGVKVTQDVLNNLRTYQQKAFFTPFAGKSERTQDGCVLARKDTL